MRDLGYIEGRDYVMEERHAGGQMDRLANYAQELVDLPVDVIVAGGEASIRAAKRATSQIPIVMTLAADPVGSGLVPTLAHPGGNVTAMSALASDLASKRVELLKELCPQAKRVVVLWNPSNQSKVTEWKDTQLAAQSAALTLLPFDVQTSAEIDRAFPSIHLAARVTLLHYVVAALDIAEIAHAQHKLTPQVLGCQIIARITLQIAEPDGLALLPPCRDRPYRHRTTEQRYELAPPHSITSSAVASSAAGTVRPSNFAALRLRTNSNLVGCSTGSSAGAAPRRILST
jgi:hypothetical protein